MQEPAPTPPATVTVGCHTYTVDTSHATILELRDEGSKGTSDADKLLIQLDNTRPPSVIAETLLHEVLHCCWTQAGLLAAKQGDDTEERAVTALTPLLLGVLRANPDTVAYLTAA